MNLITGTRLGSKLVPAYFGTEMEGWQGWTTLQVDAGGSRLLRCLAAAVSQLWQCFVPPLGGLALGDMWLSPSSSAGEKQGSGCPCTHPQGQGQAASPSPEPRELVRATLGASMVVTGYSYGGTGDWYGGCWVLVQRLLGMGTEFTGGRSWGLLSSSSCESMALGLIGLILVAEAVFG